MKSFITSIIGNTVGAVGSFTGGIMMATGINPGYVGDQLHRAGNEFADGMHKQSQALAEQEAVEAADREAKRHEERCLEIAMAAAAEQARHDKATGVAA